MISLRNHGIHKDKAGKNVMTDLGYNYRMTDIQAVLGSSQLPKINVFIRKRNQVAKWYEKFLGNSKYVLLPKVLPGNYSAWHIYVIRTKTSTIRNSLVKYLKNNGIGVNFHYPAVYSHPYYRNNGFKNTYLKNEESYHNTCITLPLHTGLKQKDIRYISDQIKNFYHAN